MKPLTNLLIQLKNFPNNHAKITLDINLTKSKWEAIKCLIEGNSIIIKEADKGGASVIMYKED